MLDLIPGIAVRSPDRRSWWERHVVSSTHREPDVEADPDAFLRLLSVCIPLCLLLWALLGWLVWRPCP